MATEQHVLQNSTYSSTRLWQGGENVCPGSTATSRRRETLESSSRCVLYSNVYLPRSKLAPVYEMYQSTLVFSLGHVEVGSIPWVAFRGGSIHEYVSTAYSRVLLRTAAVSCQSRLAHVDHCRQNLLRNPWVLLPIDARYGNQSVAMGIQIAKTVHSFPAK